MCYRTRTLFTIMVLFMRSISWFGLEVKEVSSSQCHEGSTSSSCVLERSREVTMVARVHMASKYYIQTMLSLGRCLSTTNISYAIIRCTVPGWWARPGAQGCWEHILSTLYATCAYLVGWNGLSVFTLDDKVTTRYYPLVYPLSSYVHPPIQVQHTDEHTNSSQHHPLSKSQHTPLLCSPAIELALNGIRNNFPQSYPTSSSPLIHAIHPKQSPRNLVVFTRLFIIIKSTTWLDHDLLHLPVLAMATPTGKYSSQLEIIKYLSR